MRSSPATSRSPPPRTAAKATPAAAMAGGISEAQHGAPPGAGMRDEGFGFETMFMAVATSDKPSTSTGIRSHYESIGESVLVAGDARAIKVHIHNERPDQVLAYALGLGDALEDHDREPRHPDGGRPRDARGSSLRDRGGRGRNRRRSAGRSRRDGSARRGSQRTRPSNGATPFPSPNAILPRGRRRCRRRGPRRDPADFGVHKVVYGGQTQNPSTGELLEAVKAVDAREVLLLPNNLNIVLAARQVAAMTDRPVAVVATRNAAEGFAAAGAIRQGRGRQRAGDDHRGTRCPGRSR